jgi:PDZ domain-containing secreted protein
MTKHYDKFSKAITKHVMGNQDEFKRIKDKMVMCEYATSKAGAAALGYLMAMEEMEELKSEVETSVYDKVLEVVDGLIACDGQHFAESACDEIFTIIYEWLDDELERVGNAKKSSDTRTMFRDEMHNDIGKLFREYLVQK